MGAGSLEDGVKGAVITFFGLGILLTALMALILATLIKRKSKDKSSDGWWPVPR